MQRDETQYLRDMLLYARRTHEYTANLTRAEFDANPLLAAGIVYHLQIIGEAASRVSKEYKQIQPSIRWDLISRMRNRLVHNYFDINYEVVSAAATTEMQPLIDVLKKLVSDE